MSRAQVSESSGGEVSGVKRSAHYSFRGLGGLSSQTLSALRSGCDLRNSHGTGSCNLPPATEMPSFCVSEPLCSRYP